MNSVRRLLAIAALGLVLGSLVSCTLVRTEGWPAGAPERAWFSQLFAADARNRALQQEEDYLLWVGRFYSGVPPVAGWLELSREVLAGLEEPLRSQVRPRLDALGRKISGEWAKHNSLRKINNRVGNVWRDALNEALAQEDLEPYLERLEADVDALLAGTLDPGAIRFERYYEDEFEF